MIFIEIAGDATPDVGFANNGRNIHFVGDKTNDFSFDNNHSMDYYRQMVDSVDNAAWEKILKELKLENNQHIYIGGEMLDADYIVDGRNSNPDASDNEGHNTLTDPWLSDYDIYYGGRGNDTLTGGKDKELLLGGSGNDTLKGKGGIDRLYGDAGNDTLNGGGGIDYLYGGSGNDIYIIDGTDVVNEKFDEGIDKVNSKLSYALPDNVENLTLMGIGIITGTGNDLANKLTGNSAANQLDGGSGNDILDGGKGADMLTGGAGKDKFKFTTMGHIDTITDFVVIDDTIQLENAVFMSLIATGTLAASQFVIGTGALDADDFVIYNNTTGALLYDADGNGIGAAVQIAAMGVGLAVTHADFVVI